MALSSDRFTASLYADLRNSGLRNIDIAKKLSVSNPTLSRMVSRWFSEGVLYSYYNISLEHLTKPAHVYVFTVDQRIDLKDLRIIRHSTVSYYSPLPRPTYICYCIACNEPVYDDRLFMNDMFSEMISGIVKKTLFPVEHYTRRSIDFIGSSKPVKVDDYDEYIVRVLFKLSNPPLTGQDELRLIHHVITRYMSFTTFKNHYYRHVFNKLVRRRIVFRGFENSVYAIMLIYSNSLNNAEKLLRELYIRGILNGVDQVNVVEVDPTIALAHVWVNEDYLWNENISHEYIGYTKYDIYFVKPII